MKHITKQASKQLCVHLLMVISLLTITPLGQAVDSLSGWIACPPGTQPEGYSGRVPPSFSQPVCYRNKRAGVGLRVRQERLWCYVADSWPRPFLRSMLLAILWSWNGQQTPAWLIGWPWLLWLWQVMTTVWPELGQYTPWRSGGKLLWQGQQLVVWSALSLGLGAGIRHVAESSLLWPGGYTGLKPWSMSGSTLPYVASLGCVFCGREEPWIDVVREADDHYTVTL